MSVFDPALHTRLARCFPGARITYGTDRYPSGAWGAEVRVELADGSYVRASAVAPTKDVAGALVARIAGAQCQDCAIAAIEAGDAARLCDGCRADAEGGVMNTDLIRRDLALTARAHGMRCVAHLAMTTDSAAVWDMIARDLSSARGRTGNLQARRVLGAAIDAADNMVLGRVDTAVARLAECCDATPAEWLASKRAEKV